MPTHFRAAIMGSECSYLSVSDMYDDVLFVLTHPVMRNRLIIE